MSTRADNIINTNGGGSSSNEEEATEVVSVMSPPSASVEPGPKGASSEKKGKGPKILQKLWPRKGAQQGSSPALATLTLSSTTATSTTPSSQGRMMSQSQQELPPMSPGKTRKRMLFRHSQAIQTPAGGGGGGAATPSHSLLTSSSSSIPAPSSSPTPFSSSSSSSSKTMNISYKCHMYSVHT